MKKEKRIYLKPQVEVMDVQTEGVIAASGDGEIIIPDVPDEYVGSLRPECTKGGNINQLKNIGDCIYFTVNYSPCSDTWRYISPKIEEGMPVNIEYTSNIKGEKLYKVTLNPKNPCVKSY